MQTEINSGFRFVPNIGMKSARKNKNNNKIIKYGYVVNLSTTDFLLLKEIQAKISFIIEQTL